MKKEDLIKLIKDLIAVEDLSTRLGDLNFVKREVRRINDRDEETFFEKTLKDEVNGLFDELSKKAESLSENSYESKKAIIEKAKELVNKEGIKNLSKDMNDLFNQFKNFPRCSKEQDDQLWAEMKAVKDAVNKKLSEHFAAQKALVESNKDKKEEILAKAKEALALENIKQAGEKFDELMEEWKKAGYAGKENDDNLWQEFSAIRKEYFAKRKNHFEEMKKVFKERAAKKEELIKKVKDITADAYFESDEIKEIKSIQNEFKKIGFAGKDCNDDLYERFQAAVKQYFDDYKFYN